MCPEPACYKVFSKYKDTTFFSRTLFSVSSSWAVPCVFSRVSYILLLSHFPQLSPTFLNFRIFTDIYLNLPLSILEAPLKNRSFDLIYFSVLPQFFVVKRKNEGRNEEELKNNERPESDSKTSIVPGFHPPAAKKSRKSLAGASGG